MAGGKLSPRQKMINLMYLVFIAMMAMNMSKEVLSAFGSINERIIEFNERRSLRNDVSYDGLELKAIEQPEKYKSENEQAKNIRVLSNNFKNYVEDIKNKILADLDLDEPDDYEAMDRADFLDEYFFEGGKLSKAGQAYLDEIASYKNGVVQELGGLDGEYKDVANLVNNLFDTSDITDNEGIVKNYLEYNYLAFPAIASLTKLTEMQSGISRTETEVLSAMLQGQLSMDAGISTNTYETIFLPTKPSFFPGEQVTGKIVLGRYDKDLMPSEVVVNNISVTEFERGGAVLNFPAGNVGDQDLKGKFVFIQDGQPVEIPIDTKYTVVAKPSDAVISATKMNVVYRGLQNPMTISVPGVADNKVEARAKGLRKVNGVGKYMMTPSTGKEVKINVSFTLPDGTTESSSKTYRIKDIPKPMATVRKESGIVRMPKASLAKTTVRVELPDFLFDLEFKIQSFKIKVPGQATITVNGSKLDAQAQTAVNRARVGDIIAIFDVKSTIVGVSGLRVPDALPVNIEIQ